MGLLWVHNGVRNGAPPDAPGRTAWGNPVGTPIPSWSQMEVIELALVAATRTAGTYYIPSRARVIGSSRPMCILVRGFSTYRESRTLLRGIYGPYGGPNRGHTLYSGCSQTVIVCYGVPLVSYGRYMTIMVITAHNGQYRLFGVVHIHAISERA